MPEDSKKNQSKTRNDPKEQRRKRQNRQPVASADKKIEKGPECPQVPVTEKQPPPVYEPPPEFYKNLKRETDEILKITEEENAKYKKKEIQSNWAKYEMPVETYEEIDEQESLGADYQALIDASLSVGGHFQFKHEKSWDTNTGPSPYDKYFDINMDNLNLALCSIPFYERNNIDKGIFNETDIQTMNQRSIKYKQKYYNDKRFTTPELDAQNKILDNLKNPDEKSIHENYDEGSKNSKCEEVSRIDELGEKKYDAVDNIDKINLSEKKELTEIKESHLDNSFHDKKQEIITKECHENKLDLVPNENIVNKKVDIAINKKELENELDAKICLTKKEIPKARNVKEPETKSNIVKNAELKELDSGKQQANNPVIESPEDLEKWLDDFLDG